tara:strand:- start:212 stop:1051 length:840 start_codon:yes stop_codon:yes gene_type:complete
MPWPSLVSVLCVFAVVGIWFLVRSRGKRRSPGTEELLRSPGHSVSIKLDEIQENISTLLVFLIFAPPFALAFNSERPIPYWGIAPLAVGYVVALYYFFKLLTKSSNYRLGLMGERAVGEELNQLMLDGFRVFHDFPADQNWNIDHVLVGSQGVYIVETKARRKQQGPAGHQDHVIIYDGHILKFPHCEDQHGLKQATRNARWLGNFLSSATGEPVTVRPILTFPGWYIELKTKDTSLRVLNPKQIRKVIIKNDPPNKLSPEQVERITHQLEQKCRDVQW